MINIEVYNLRDIQMFLSLLNQFESDGVSDVRFVRERLERRLIEQAVNKGRVVRQTVRSHKAKRAKELKKCPSCGIGVLVGPYQLEGLTIVRCSKKCGFSEVTA